MKLRLYILMTLLLLVVMGAYVHVEIGGEYTLTVAQSSYTLPIAIWLILPAALVFLTSLAHMSFYTALGALRRRALSRDLKALKKLIGHALLGQKSDVKLKHPELQALSAVLSHAQIVLKQQGIKTKDPELDGLLEAIEQVEQGEVATFDKIRPSSESPIWVQNQFNRMAADPKASEEVLRECKEPSPLSKEALKLYAAFGDKRRILKSEHPLTPQAATVLLGRMGDTQNPLSFEIEEIEGICQRAEFAERDYLLLAKELKTAIQPDRLLEIFFQLRRQDERAASAWLYLNIELERHDEVRDMLEGTSEEEFSLFRDYFALKNAGLTPNLDEMIA